MEKGTNNVWKICFIIAVLVIIGLVIYIVANPSSKKGTSSDQQVSQGAEFKSSTQTGKNAESNSTTSSNEDTLRNIRIDEDFSTDGKIEGVENARWNNARIMQHDGKMEVSIMINNESEKEKIPAKTLIVKLLDKSGKTIASKEVKMKEIADKYGYTSLDMEFDMKDIAVVYNIDISVKK